MSKPKIIEELLEKTIPEMFLERVRNSETETAFRYKDLGIYKEVTWGDYWREGEDFAFGLMELGLAPGETVAIMADPVAEWMFSYLGIIAAGGIDFGVYTTSSIEEIHYTMEVGEAKFFIAENQEHVDKLFLVIDHLPRLSKIIVVDTRTMFMYDDPRIISFAEVQEIGRKRKANHPQELRERISKIKPSDPCTIIFTSGTSGFPKPSLLTHQNALVGTSLPFSDCIPELWDLPNRTICHLSLAHLAERVNSLYNPLLYPVTPHIGESAQYLQETLYEVQPTLVIAVPRIYEKIAGQAIIGIENSSWIKRFVYRLAMSVGRKYMEMKWSNKKIPLMWRSIRWLSIQLCFRHLLHQLGFPKIRYAFTMGAPMPPPTQMLWQIWGADMMNFYGATESGLVCVESPGFQKAGNIGKPTSINRVELAEDGELIVSGPGVFAGYFKNEEATAEVLKNGRFHSGDIGEFIEDGKIRLIDRKKDIMITSGGKNITPSQIESCLKGSPYISEAVLIADGKKFPSALIEIDFETVSDWARRNKISYTGFTSLTTDPRVIEMIGDEIKKANQSLARVEQVKKFRIIPKELDPEEGDTTATRKIKRKTMYKLFQDLIDEMYGGTEENLFETQVGGKKGGDHKVEAGK